MPEYVAVQRIVVEDHRLDDLFDDALVRQRNIAGAETLAPAGDTFVSFHLDQMRAALGIVLLRIAQFLGHVVLQNVARDTGDFHGVGLSSSR